MVGLNKPSALDPSWTQCQASGDCLLGGSLSNCSSHWPLIGKEGKGSWEAGRSLLFCVVCSGPEGHVHSDFPLICWHKQPVLCLRQFETLTCRQRLDESDLEGLSWRGGSTKSIRTQQSLYDRQRN